MSDKLSMAGKVALSTGSAKGMVVVHSRLITERGGAIIIAEVDDPVGEKFAAELRAKGADARYVHLDVTNEKDWLSAVAGAMKSHGKVNVLVKNAGVAVLKVLNESTVEKFDFVFGVNMKGLLLGCKDVLPAMQAGLDHQYLLG